MPTGRRKSPSAPTPAPTIRKHITGQRASGLSIAAYCRKHSLSQWTFYGWCKRQRSSSTPQRQKKSSMTFTELPATAGSPTPFEFVFAGGVRLRVNAGFRHEDLMTLLAAMEHRERC